MKIDEACKYVILSKEKIEEICKSLGERISEDYKGQEVTLVGLLNGCNPFFCDLVKHIDLLVKLDYMKASSYHGSTVATTEVMIQKDLDHSVKGKNVIVVDDIIDTGETVKCITELLKTKGAKSVEVCVLLDKDRERQVAYVPKYVGTKIPNEFVVGYGLDYQEFYRNLPYIGAISDKALKGEI